MTEISNDWIYIRFKASPELFERLRTLKGKDRRWWEFFRDEYADGEG